jgi:hypothetical protein
MNSVVERPRRQFVASQALDPLDVRRAASETDADRGVIRTMITPTQDPPLQRAQRLADYGIFRLWPRESGQHDDSADHVGAPPKTPGDLVLGYPIVSQPKNPALKGS